MTESLWIIIGLLGTGRFFRRCVALENRPTACESTPHEEYS